MSRVILSYHDSLIRESDIEIIQRNKEWLNDTIIGFYFEYLQHDADSNFVLKDKFFFASPELTQLLKYVTPTNNIKELYPLDYYDRNIHFFPINNCNSMEQAGGTHWSLLVMVKTNLSCEFYHLDTLRSTNKVGANHDAAYQLYKAVGKEFGQTTKFIDVLDMVVQHDDYNCGLYVLCITDVILKNWKEDLSRPITKMNLLGDVVNPVVDKKRRDLLNLIKELKCENRKHNA